MAHILPYFIQLAPLLAFGNEWPNIMGLRPLPAVSPLLLLLLLVLQLLRPWLRPSLTSCASKLRRTARMRSHAARLLLAPPLLPLTPLLSLHHLVASVSESPGTAKKL